MNGEEMTPTEGRPHVVRATQFLRPGGRRRDGGFYVNDEVFQLANELLDRGYRFECEVLVTGEVSADCCGPDPETEEDVSLDIFVCENGPVVLEEFDSLVRRVHARVVGGSNG